MSLTWHCFELGYFFNAKDSSTIGMQTTVMMKYLTSKNYEKLPKYYHLFNIKLIIFFKYKVININSFIINLLLLNIIITGVPIYLLLSMQ